jgi:hypothetical protein
MTPVACTPAFFSISRLNACVLGVSTSKPRSRVFRTELSENKIA